MDTFNNCEIVINNKRKIKADMLSKMDTYLLNNRISSEQYNELVSLMDEVGLE
jgi:hypothetical protein